MPRPDGPVSINQAEWARLKRELDKFSPALALALRRSIKSAGQDAVSAVKTEVRQPAPTNAGDSRGSREEIARATRLAVSFSARGAGVKIITRNTRSGFAKAYNKESFRHPVYGGGGWTEQQGRPYFGSSINRTMRLELVGKVMLALDVAIRAIGGRGK